MILIINGSFGVGKTTVGRLLRQKIARSRLYNPEWIGSVLMRLPTRIKLRGSGTNDFQDIELWRQSVIYGTKICRAFAGSTVIVPMAFSNRTYLEQVISGMSKFDDQIKIYCLKAGIKTILGRLEQRGENIESEAGKWIIRKAEECIHSHQDIYFGEPINTEAVSATAVTNEILRRLDEFPKSL